jgi:HD-GYP domain-containing protein (c-di-GMP phosphodiesterase class II)
VAVPVPGEHRLHGVVLLHYDPGRVAHDVALHVQAHAARVQAALAYSTLQITAAQGSLEALVRALAAHDPDTGQHSQAVARLVNGVGKALALPPRARLELEQAAQLHDVGKIGIPGALLQKAGPLTSAEWGAMREHPAVGERIVQGVPNLCAVGLAIRHHHERWDGSGYPDRLAGSEIPFNARLIALVDAYETITVGRSYHPSRCPTDALHELEASAGSQFDPALVSVLRTRRPDQRSESLGLE